MAYGRIVFGTDGSDAAVRAGDVATALAKAGRAQFIAVSAFLDPSGIEERLAQVRAAAETAGIRATRIDGVARQGAPTDVIVSVAEDRDAGLIVISGGRGQRYALADVARRLARRTPCDLLIVSDLQERDSGLYSRILIATDGSTTADRCARKGYELATALEASVDLVFVGHPATGKLITDDTVGVYAGEVETRVHVLSGEPATTILQAADDLYADLIVVGNKGMTGARGFLIGSVPEKVLEAADRDVLLCRTVVQTVSEIAPSEGGVIERQGEKLAAYMDESGELHLMSARCTHLGCTVGWNPGEKTFDCPCHGSRYSPLGAVVNGPAARPLPPA